jgi:hypothetical protein
MRRRAVVLVLLLAALQVSANQLWLSWDEGIQYTDAAFHYSQVVERKEALSGGSAALVEQWHTDEKQRYGSFYYLLATGVSLLTGSEARNLLGGLSLVLWPLLLLGSFRLGFELAAPGRQIHAGLLSAAFAGMLPGLFNYSRVLVLDLPLAIAVAWTTAFLLAAIRKPQKARRMWLGAGISLTLGLAIKINALAFLIGPLWVAARAPLRALSKNDRKRFVQIVTATAIGILACSCWLLLGARSSAIIETILDSTWPGKLVGYAQDGALSSYPGHYLKALQSHSWEVFYYSTLQSFTPPLLIAVLSACIWFFARKRGCQDPLAHTQRDLVFWAVAVPMVGVVFLLGDIYDERYLLPLLPLFAALVGSMLWDIPHRLLRNGTLAVIVVGGTLNFAAISFDVLPALRPLACGTVAGWSPHSRVGNELWLCALYPKYHFMDRASSPLGAGGGGPLDGERGAQALREIEARLQPLREEAGQPLAATFLDDLYPLFYRSYDQSLRRTRRDSRHPPLFRQQDLLLLSKCTNRGWLTALFESLDGIEETIAGSDVVLMRYGSPNDPNDTALRGRRCIVFWQQQRHWLHLGDVTLSDGTSVRLYRRKPGTS